MWEDANNWRMESTPDRWGRGWGWGERRGLKRKMKKGMGREGGKREKGIKKEVGGERDR